MRWAANRGAGKTADAAEQLIRAARCCRSCRGFRGSAEAVPRELAAHITRELRIPRSGVGAGPECDGQILVLHDAIGLLLRRCEFARDTQNVGEMISKNVSRSTATDVRAWEMFPPSDAESYHAARASKEEKRGAGQHGTAIGKNRFPAGGQDDAAQRCACCMTTTPGPNHRSLDAASALSEEKFVQGDGLEPLARYDDKPLRIFTGAEWIWLRCDFSGARLQSLPDTTQFKNMAELRER